MYRRTAGEEVVLDVKESRITGATRRTLRFVLPRFSDAMSEALDMMSHVNMDEEVFILDLVDAISR